MALGSAGPCSPTWRPWPPSSAPRSCWWPCSRPAWCFSFSNPPRVGGLDAGPSPSGLLPCQLTDRYACGHHAAARRPIARQPVEIARGWLRGPHCRQIPVGGKEQGGRPCADGDDRAGNHIVADPIRVAWPAHPSAPDAWGREYAMFPATSPLGRSCRDNTVPSGVAPRSAQPDAGGGLAACRSHQFVPWELRPGSREDMAVIISPAVPRQSRRLPLASGLIPAGAGATMW